MSAVEKKYMLLAVRSPVFPAGIKPQEISTAIVSERKNTTSASMADEKVLWETILDMPSVLKRMKRTSITEARLISR
jgi:hypothetical protein